MGLPTTPATVGKAEIFKSLGHHDAQDIQHKWPVHCAAPVIAPRASLVMAGIDAIPLTHGRAMLWHPLEMMGS